MRQKALCSAVSLTGARVGAVVCALCIGILSPAQSGPPNASTSATTSTTSVSISQGHNQPEVITHETTTFKVRVNQVLLRVVVRDKEGKAIGNLPREAFQVLDNGKPQPITSFSLTGSGVSQPSPERKTEVPALEPKEIVVPQRYVAYVFDDLHIEAPELTRVKDAAKSYLTASMTPTDRAAIFTTSGKIELDFTDSREQLLQTIARIQPAFLMRNAPDQCPWMTYYLADLILNKHDRDAKKASITDTIKCLHLRAGSDGGFTDAIGIAETVAVGAAERELDEGDADMRMSSSVLRDIIGRLSATPGQRSVVLASPGFFTRDYSLMTALFDRALHASIAINTLDVRGVWTEPVSDAQNNRIPNALNPYFEIVMHNSALYQNQVLAELADGTGGTFFQNNNDLLEGFRRTTAAPEYAYLLSFTPQNLKADGKFHNLKVVVKNPPGLTARRKATSRLAARRTPPNRPSRILKTQCSRAKKGRTYLSTCTLSSSNQPLTRRTSPL
jgi:VWFA-related protein